MEPDETKSLPQPQSPDLNGTSSKTPDTIRVPGVMPLSNPIKTVDFDEREGFWGGLRKPAKWVIAGLLPVAVVILLGSGLFNMAKWAIGSWSAKKPVTQPATAQPVVTPSASPVAKSNNGCADLPGRMAQAKITGQQVDKVFYQAHPDRVNKPLTAADSGLTQEWCAIADRLIAQKSAK